MLHRPITAAPVAPAAPADQVTVEDAIRAVRAAQDATTGYSFAKHMFGLIDQDRMLGRHRAQPEGDCCPMCDGSLDEGRYCHACQEAV